MMSATATAPELPLEAPPQNPLELYCGLLNHLTEQLRDSGSITYKIASWLVIIKILQYLEDHVGPESSGMITHQSLIHICLGYGEALLGEAKQMGGITREGQGLTMAELTAHLAWLRDKLVMWHTEMTPTRKASILRGVFGVET
jgi:hypothetical protein